jgi:hypothetical protein
VKGTALGLVALLVAIAGVAGAQDQDEHVTRAT